MNRKIGDNILKLEGYGLYVTIIDGELWECPIVPVSGGPTLDANNCIEWTKCSDPPNQKFLNIVNAEFGVNFTLNHFDKAMTVYDVMSFAKAKREAKRDAV